VGYYTFLGQRDTNIGRKVFSQPTVVVRVGRHGQEFNVPKGLAIRYSGYFREALRPDSFKEGEPGVVTVPDTDPQSFQRFIHWLYHQQLPPSNVCMSCEDHDLSSSLKVTTLYVLAHLLLVPDLKQLVMEFAYNEFFYYETPENETISFAFEHLPRISPYLELLVDSFCDNWYVNEVDEESPYFSDLPEEFVQRAMLNYADLKRTETRDAMRPTSYYADFDRKLAELDQERAELDRTRAESERERAELVQKRAEFEREKAGYYRTRTELDRTNVEYDGTEWSDRQPPRKKMKTTE
jgi:hypothetical protein